MKDEDRWMRAAPVRIVVDEFGIKRIADAIKAEPPPTAEMKRAFAEHRALNDATRALVRLTAAAPKPAVVWDLAE